MTQADLVVLGAGPAGLGAAYRAARAGVRVVVLEREDRVGGAAGSFEVDGVRVDHGSHRLHPSTDPEILAELDRLLGGDLQRRPRAGRIRLGGRWLGFPLRPVDAARSLPVGFMLGAARDMVVAPLRHPRADSYAEHLRAGLGPTLAERFYFPYARKLWGVPPEALSAEQARRRVRNDRAGALLSRVLRAGRGDAGVFYYPRRGYGQLSEALADAAVAAGADLRLSSAARRVRCGPERVEVDTDGEVITATQVWSTVPLTVLARLADPAPPDRVLTAARRLAFRGLLLVYLVLDADRYTPFDAHYLPELSTPVSRLSEPKNYRDGQGSDPAGRTVVCAEIPCTPGDDLWNMSDASARDLVVAMLRANELPQAGIGGVVVRRLPYAYPVYLQGFEAAFGVLDEWAAATPGLLTFGRQGLFAHDNAHHALAMAWSAADALGADGQVDATAWAQARARFRTHVVED